MIVSQAAVITLMNLLIGRTWAEDRVFAQVVDPIRDILDGQAGHDRQRPYISIYDETSSADFVGNDRSGQPTRISMKVAIIIGPGLINTGDGYAPTMDSKAAGLALNVVGRQVEAAMHVADTEWHRIWNKIRRKTHDVKSRMMLVEIEDAVRIPTLELTFDIEAAAEPAIGTPIFGVWQDLDAALRAENEASLADLLKGLIENADNLPSHELFAAQQGLTAAAMQATGLPPFKADGVDDDGEAPALQNVTVSDLPQE